MSDKFKVIATFPNGKYGFFGGRIINSGDELLVDEKEFSKNWMTRVEDPKRAAGKGKDSRREEVESI